MKDCDVLMSLCIYDSRNPNWFNFGYDEQEIPENCSCDNCFYGRHDLALEIIKLRKALNLPIKNS